MSFQVGPYSQEEICHFYINSARGDQKLLRGEKNTARLCFSDSTAFFMFSILCSNPPYVK